VDDVLNVHTLNHLYLAGAWRWAPALNPTSQHQAQCKREGTITMFQDGQASPTPLASPAPLPQNPFASASRLLQVVLLAFDKHGDRDKEKDRYAAIRFPQTYEVSTLIPRTCYTSIQMQALTIL
jgi:hypothetical protein